MGLACVTLRTTDCRDGISKCTSGVLDGLLLERGTTASRLNRSVDGVEKHAERFAQAVCLDDVAEDGFGGALILEIFHLSAFSFGFLFSAFVGLT